VKNIVNDDEINSLAYLGPDGSYSQIAAKKNYPEAQGIACSSFVEAFKALDSGRADAALLPVENVSQGPVAQTLDLLFEFKGRVYISDSLCFPIQHCLGRAVTSKSEEHGKDPINATAKIEIFSHEQPLRQCSKYLDSNFPDAIRSPMLSTSAAAQHVASANNPAARAIAAEETLLKYGLEVLEHEISDDPRNQTRFLLLKRGNAHELIKDAESQECKTNAFVTSIVIDPGRDRQGILFEILQLISQTHGVNLLSIQSRPDSRGGFVFHLDLEGHWGSPSINTCLQTLKNYCRESTGAIAELIVCGSYRLAKFYDLPFKTVGIIGGNGVMGTWFQDFFARHGLEVLISDVVAAGNQPLLTIKELVDRSDVILLSVPISAMATVIDEIAPHARSGQLVVENSSIKSAALPLLESSLTDDVEVLGIHTMFSKNIESLSEQNIIITRTESSKDKSQAFENLFYKFGARLSYISAEEHDTATSILQALLHISMISIAEVMRESVSELDELEPFSTPNSRAIVQTIQRVLGQSDDLLSDLQLLNTEYPFVRRKFLESVFSLIQSLNNNDLEHFRASVESSRSFFLKNSK
jgi:prephenate dehydratase/prephenate dehydrogenase